MNESEVKTVIQTAKRLLPKYGGFVSGAVNQAFLLRGVLPTDEERRYVEAQVALDEEREAAMEGGE